MQPGQQSAKDCRDQGHKARHCLAERRLLKTAGGGAP